jgi:hypothetical protein
VWRARRYKFFTYQGCVALFLHFVDSARFVWQLALSKLRTGGMNAFRLPDPLRLPSKFDLIQAVDTRS